MSFCCSCWFYNFLLLIIFSSNLYTGGMLNGFRIFPLRESEGRPIETQKANHKQFRIIFMKLWSFDYVKNKNLAKYRILILTLSKKRIYPFFFWWWIMIHGTYYFKKLILLTQWNAFTQAWLMSMTQQRKENPEMFWH